MDCKLWSNKFIAQTARNYSSNKVSNALAVGCANSDATQYIDENCGKDYLNDTSMENENVWMKLYHPHKINK